MLKLPACYKTVGFVILFHGFLKKDLEDNEHAFIYNLINLLSH